MFIDSCWNENLYDVNLKGDFKMKKVKSLKALVLSLMLCLAMGTTAFASEVSTQGQAAPNANKAVEVSDCGDLDVVPAYDDAVALADTIQLAWHRATLQERHGYNARLRTRNELSPYVGVLRQRLSTMGRVRFVRAYLPGIILAKLPQLRFWRGLQAVHDAGTQPLWQSAYRSFSRKRHE